MRSVFTHDFVFWNFTAYENVSDRLSTSDQKRDRGQDVYIRNPLFGPGGILLCGLIGYGFQDFIKAVNISMYQNNKQFITIFYSCLQQGIILG